MRRTWWKRLVHRKETKYRGQAVGSRRPQLEWLEDRLAPANHAWNGAVSNLWSNAANWMGGSPAGDPSPVLMFPSGAANLANNNDITGLTVQSITFSASSYNITGNLITLNGGISADAGVTGADTFNPNITLGAAQTITVTNSGGMLTLGGVLTGAAAAGLTVSGAGTLVLAGTNMYAGNTTLSSGTLTVSNNSALGTGSLILSGGSLQASAAVILANALTVAGAASVSGSNNITFSSNATLAAVLTVSNTAATNFSGIVSGPGGLTVVAGTGSVLLSMTNAYSGATTLTSGTLTMGANNALGTGALALGGGTIQSNAPVSISNSFTVGGAAMVGGTNNLTFTGTGTLTAGNTLTVAAAATTTFQGTLSGPGNLTMAGGGSSTLTLANSNTYSGTTTLTSGTLSLAVANALGAGALALNGGTLVAAFAGAAIANNFTVGGPASIGGGNNMTFSGQGTLSAGNILTISNTGTTTFSGVLSGAGGITVAAGTGTVVLSGANTYVGTTTLTSGTLTVGSNLGMGLLALNGGTLTASIGAGALANSFTVSGTATIGGSNIVALNGAGTLSGSSTLTVTNTAGTVLSGALSGSGALTIAASTGTVLLFGANTYSGTTTLTSGTLTVGNNSALGMGSLVLNGGTLQANAPVTLANPFTVGGAVTIAGFVGATGSVGGSINFTGPGMLGTGNTLTVTNTQTTTFSGVLSGGGSLTIAAQLGAGTGTVVLGNANTYSGTTTVSSGQLIVNTNTSLGTGALVMDGTLPTRSLAAGANFITLSNPFIIGAQGASITGNDTFVLTGKGTLNGTLTVSNTASTVGLSGGLSGSGGITRGNQPGTLVLGGLNTYTGPTSVSGGFLQLSAAGALPSGSAVTVASGATLLFNNFDQTIGSLAGAGAVNLGGANLTTGGDNSSTTFSGTITNGGGLTKAGTGTFTLTAINSIAGPISVNAGILQLGAANALGGTFPLTVASGATFDLNNFSTFIGSLAGAGNVTLGTAAGATLTTGINNNSATFSGIISGNGAASSSGPQSTPALVKTGTGTLTLSSANTYTGGTTVGGGILQVGVANALPSTTTVFVGPGGTFDLNNFNVTIGSLSGMSSFPLGGAPASPVFAMVTLGSGTLTTDGNGPQSPFTGLISGSGGVNKVGPGTLVLSLSNSYTGPTTVGQGILQIAADTPTTSNFAVSAGASLRGSGTVGTITTAGEIRPGLPPPLVGTTLTSSNATFNAGSSLTLLLNGASPGSFTQLKVTGPLSLSGSPTLNLTVGFSQLNGLPPANSTFAIISASGGVTGTFSGLADGSSININGNVFRINYSANAVTLTLTTLASANQRFVAQVYADLLNRSVDASGLAFWSGQLDGGTTRGAVVIAIERSQEYRTLVVTGIYQTLLHRAPDSGGLSGFVTLLSSGATVEQVQSLIAGSPEYFQTRGGNSNNGFLSALYQDALNRAIDSGGQTSFLGALSSGASRSDVATVIFGSTEYRQILVQGFYTRFLRRAADTGGLNGFVNALGAGSRDEDIIAAIVGSPEYFGRV